jgi:2-polyprenyl-3-methyl-5-hydroxy-6-metoxy-1,4-benzoquinol methylase
MSGRYPITGGDTDADRLRRQAKVMAGATEEFLVRAGLREGSRCLDVGCGQGHVSIVMAQIAGNGGRVVATDVDAEALEAARLAAQSAGVNVEFVLADASDSVGKKEFDLAFSRLVLCYLLDPLSALRAMLSSVRPGGSVAVEDIFNGTLRSEPPRTVLDEVQEVFGATVRSNGGDPTIGPRLRAMLLAVGLEEISENVVSNTMKSVEEKLFLAELVNNMRPAIVQARAATEAELDDIEARTEEAARDQSTVFFQAEMYQVTGRRP